jgi:DNA-binding response OmpR family regulator
MTNGLSFPTILVAEHDDGVRSPIVRHLQYHGYFVLVAHDAAEALEITRVHSRPIHLLLTGEGLDGRTLAATLKQYRPHMQVLFITPCMRLNGGEAGNSDTTLDMVRECVKPPAAPETFRGYPLHQAKSA